MPPRNRRYVALHDGSAIDRDIDRFIYSTAVEADTLEMRAARARGIDLVPRPALLAEVVKGGEPGVAIAGATSGKSTITAMLGTLPRERGRPATIIGGAGLAHEATNGCLMTGPVDGIVVVEASESDGTLVGYEPTIGLVHNGSRPRRTPITARAVRCLRPQLPSAVRERRLFGSGRPPGQVPRRVAAGVTPDADAQLQDQQRGPRSGPWTAEAAGGIVTLDLPQPPACTTSRMPPRPPWWR